MTFESLDNVLRRFYAEARTKKGEEYSRSSLLSIRNPLERHLAASGREVKITKNPLLVKSNKMLECKLKLNRREGKENVKHGRHGEAKKQSVFKLQQSSGSSPPSLVYRNVLLVPARMRESKAAQKG